MDDHLSSNASEDTHRWAVVLAGGSGSRLAPLISKWLGEDRPKQFCPFLGTRTLLEHSLERIRPVVAPERTLIVIGPGQGRYVEDLLPDDMAERVIEQPRSRGSASAILTACCYVMAHDPAARLLITPSDHFAAPVSRFAGYCETAFRVLEEQADRALLLGVHPYAFEADYSWIETRKPADDLHSHLSSHDTQPVQGFVDHPDGPALDRLYAGSGLWDTGVAVVRLETLWQMARRCMPSKIDYYRTVTL